MAFFSGTDISTLQSEGNDTNCFVSLIVDTKGTYQAAITRKVTSQKTVTVRNNKASYEFFGEGPVLSGFPTESTSETNETLIEYFMLDVQIEPVDNPLSYLDTRFDEIESKKKITLPVGEIPNKPLNPKWSNDGSLIRSSAEDDEDFYSWIHSNRKQSAEAKEAMLFPKEEMGEVDPTKWTPDPTVIHHMVCQLLTCSFIVNKDIDLKRWVSTNMQRKYDEIFPAEETFTEWKEFILEFLIGNYYLHADVPDELFNDIDTWQGKVAEAICDELGEYEPNYYITAYTDMLMNYIIVE